MSILHAALLGAVQGLTEVLPISSSAHLILIPWLMGWPESGLTFDVSLHLGTLIALLIYFWRDILDLCVNVASGLGRQGFRDPSTRLPLYLIAGTIPAAVFGKTLETPIEELFRKSPALIATFRSGEIHAIYAKWFTQPIPPTGQNLNFPMSDGLKQLIAEPTDKSAEQI